MRVSPLKDRLAARGAVFRPRWGVETVARCGERRAEYEAIRHSVGLTDFSFARTFVFPEEKGLDFLDGLLAGNVPKIRFGRVLHTFLADGDGLILGDCYVANNDHEFVLICESILSDAELDGLLRGAGAEAAEGKDLTGDHVLLSVDGVKAWAVVKHLFGADVLGLPYLSIENYSFQGRPVRLLRAGKTSEFGYLVLAPGMVAGALFDALLEQVEDNGGRLCGVDVHDDLRLEGRFFNIQREGERARDPLILGLQWMVDFNKESFQGREALFGRRAEGLKKKIVGMSADRDCESLQEGVRVFQDVSEVGEVVTSCYSGLLDRRLGLAILPAELAYSGLCFTLGGAEGPVARTISMPPILPKSLMVKLDEM